ncbi:MAG TPA: cyclic nucleotide-binding domain-containing protein [Polyangiaceae bacterium]|nr:cyclic nucleotide-binding domain-containing protein [Polyangiaceae bacterium]
MSVSELRYSAVTDVGRQREHNEDNFLVDKKLSLFMVCDGMGGHAAGEVASALAVRVIHEEIKREIDLLQDYVAAKTGVDRVTKRDITNMLEFAVNRASARVHAEALRDPSKRGMGTTLVLLLVLGQQAFITYCGDSRVYLLRDGVLEQVTEDHTVYNELIRRKKLPRERIEEIAPKNAITRAVGVFDHAEPESLVIDLVSGDRFLLCSDGLSGYFEDQPERLGALLSEASEDLVTQSLIEAANAAGGKDNITTVVVTVGDATTRDEKRARRIQLQRDILTRMPLFRTLSDREILRLLQVTVIQAYRDGEVIIREGDIGEDLFIVLAGEVKVKKGDTDLARLTPGEHFGEMALIRNQPRSATVTSNGDSELIVLSRSEFFEILRKEHQLAVKLLWQFTGVLADRLAQTNRELGHAREELAAEDITAEMFVDGEEDGRKTLVSVNLRG